MAKHTKPQSTKTREVDSDELTPELLKKVQARALKKLELLRGSSLPAQKQRPQKGRTPR